MKTSSILLFFFFLFYSFGYAQIKREIAPFTAIRVSGSVDVYLHKASSPALELKVNGEVSADDIISKVKDDKLLIYIKPLKSFKEFRAKVHVYYQDLEEITVNTGSHIHQPDGEFIERSKLSVSSNTGGNLEIYCTVDSLIINCSQGSRVLAQGSANFQDVDLTAGGEFQGEKLISKQSKVTVKAGGLAKILAIDHLDVSVSAGGKVMYYGEPKKIEQSITLGGSIIKLPLNE